MKALLRICYVCALIVAVPASAAPRSSATYSIPAEMLDAGGATAVSPNYHQSAGSIGMLAGVQTSAAYGNAGGFLQGEVVSAAAPATVTTPTSANVTASTAALGGNVESDGGAAITERGVVYAPASAGADLFIENEEVVKVIADGTTGVFTVDVTNLTPATEYQFKAYARNSRGTSYTDIASFTTLAPAPTVATIAAANVTSSSATLRGFVSANGASTTVDVTASDAAGNTSAVHKFTVTVRDTTAPAIAAHANVSAAATSASGAVVTFTAPTASDLVDGPVAVTCEPASGSTFPIGATTVTCTATDSRGNSSSTTFTVTVTSNAPTVAVNGSGGGGGTVLLDAGFDGNSGTVPAGWMDIGFDTNAASTIVESGGVVTITDTRSGGGPQLLQSPTFGPVTGFSLTADLASLTTNASGEPEAIIALGQFSGGKVLLVQFNGSTRTFRANVFGASGATTVTLPGSIAGYAGGPLSVVVTADADSLRVTSSATGYDSGDVLYTAFGAASFDSIDDLGSTLAVVLGVESRTGTQNVTLAHAAFDRVVLTTGASGGGSTAVTAVEGSPATQTGTFSDGDGNATVTLTASAGTITQNNGAGTWTWTDTRDDGPLTETITITATDSTDATATTTFEFTVTNAAPTVTIDASTFAAAGTFTFTATDPSSADQAAGFVWTLDYGDGRIDTTDAGWLSPLDFFHRYASAGTYVVRATATDKDGGTSEQASATVVVTPQQLAVEYPDGTSLANGTTIDLGTVPLIENAVSTRTFTLRNTGMTSLTLSALTLTGGDANDFSLDRSGMPPGAKGASSCCREDRRR